MESNKIEQIIKLVGGLTVIELSDCIKEFEKHFGVSAAAPTAAAPAAGAEAPKAKEEEKSEYKVVLTNGGPEKIKAIKALRKILPDLNLSDAKNAVDNPPFTIAESAAKDAAATMKKDLEEVGAKVELA